MFLRKVSLELRGDMKRKENEGSSEVSTKDYVSK